MNAWIAVVGGLLIASGAVGLAIGLTRRPVPGRRRSGRSARALWAATTRRPVGAAGRRRDAVLFASIAGGFVAAAVSGWVIMVALVPVLALGLPYLLMAPKARDVDLMEALDRWIRTIAATLGTGRSVPDAIRISRRSAPQLIRVEVEALATRLNARWDTVEALRRFADDLASPDVDAATAALILASRRGGNGAAETLDALAESIQSQLKARRLIEVERSKPYVVVRQVTAVSLATLVIAFVFSPDFFAPYRSPLGQTILSVLLAAYLGSLLAMRRKATARLRSRILLDGQR